MATAPIFDLEDPCLLADPYPTLAQLRRTTPVCYSRELGGWLVTRYSDVVAAFRDTRLSSDRISPFMAELPEARCVQMAPLWRSLSSWSVFADPPAHGRLRGLFQRAFRKGAMGRLEPRIHTLVGQLLDGLPLGEEFDFISQFAYPLPAMVICDLLGLPHSDIDSIRAWSDDIAVFIGLPTKPVESFDRALASDRALATYFGQRIAERRSTPGEELISQLLEAADESEGAVGDDEVIATCGLLLFAAHTTTTHMLGNALVASTATATNSNCSIGRTH